MSPQRDIRIGIIGGSGLDTALGLEQGSWRQVDTPFGPPSAPILLTHWEGLEVAILARHGPGHTYPPSFIPYRANIFALKALGITHIIASGATGSLREQYHPGELVLIDQVIDKTCRRASSFYEHAAVHVEFSYPFCPIMRRWLLSAARTVPGLMVHDRGTYVCMEGPAFSTVAESQMHRAWGADVVGMTACPEAKLAREAEIAYALVALPTDYDCWRPHDPAQGQQQLLAEIIGNLQAATAASVALLRAALRDVTALRAEPSPAHEALKLAIWSDKAKIDPAEVQRLQVLWGRYFEPR
jgi:5'-methylthioadenosine phosphorylase